MSARPCIHTTAPHLTSPWLQMFPLPHSSAPNYQNLVPKKKKKIVNTSINNLIKVDGHKISPPIGGGTITCLQHVGEVAGVLHTGQ